MTKVSNKIEKPKVVNLGGLNPTAVYTATGKVTRAQHNAERHSSLSGQPVEQAIASRQVTAQDIKYDVAKGFVKLA